MDLASKFCCKVSTWIQIVIVHQVEDQTGYDDDRCFSICRNNSEVLFVEELMTGQTVFQKIYSIDARGFGTLFGSVELFISGRLVPRSRIS